MAYIGSSPSYGVFDKQVETGDGSTTAFSLDYAVPSATALLVSIDGIIQEPDEAFTVGSANGTPTLTFSGAPENGARIFIVYMGRQLLVATQALSSPHIDQFSGDGSTTGFTLTRTPTAASGANLVVFVDGVYQVYGSSDDYTISGVDITFSSAPSSGTRNIQVIQLSEQNNVIDTVADGSITNVKTNFTYGSLYNTGDGSTTAFTIDSGHSVNSVIVTENGVIQRPTSDYAVSGTTLTFTTAPASGVQIGVRYLPVQG